MICDGTFVELGERLEAAFEFDNMLSEIGKYRIINALDTVRLMWCAHHPASAHS
jgi:hypothetical protein